MPLINCKVEFSLTRVENCALAIFDKYYQMLMMLLLMLLKQLLK